MLFVYNLAIRLVFFFGFLLQPFSNKIHLWYRGRKDQFYDLNSKIASWKNDKVFWIHAASYGEFEMGRPIIERIQKSYPNAQFLISFFSPSGYERIHLDPKTFYKIYLPFDTKKNQKKIIEAFDPQCFISIKYDFWFNLLSVLKENKVPYYFTSIHLNADSYLFKKPFKKFKDLLKSATCLFAHSSISNEIFIKEGFSNSVVFGDTRITQVLKNKAEFKSLEVTVPDTEYTVAFGSISSNEERTALQFINRNPNIGFIIAPHDLDKKTHDFFHSNTNEPISLLSNSKKRSKKILYVNTYGDLKYLYGFADVAYIGGGFKKGPHNVLEPLVFGCQVIIGPNIAKFPMARYLNDKGLIHIINDLNQLENKISELLKTSISKLEIERRFLEEISIEFTAFDNEIAKFA